MAAGRPLADEEANLPNAREARRDAVAAPEHMVGESPEREPTGLKAHPVEFDRDAARVREARRAYRRFHAQCFWSYPPDLEIGLSDVSWVAERLRKNGNRRAWLLAERLRR